MKVVKRKSDGEIVYRQEPEFETGKGIKSAVANFLRSCKPYEVELRKVFHELRKVFHYEFNQSYETKSRKIIFFISSKFISLNAML